jgi:hypothetical protein
MSDGRHLNILTTLILVVFGLLIGWNLYKGITVREIGIPGFTVKFGPDEGSSPPKPTPAEEPPTVQLPTFSRPEPSPQPEPLTTTRRRQQPNTVRILAPRNGEQVGARGVVRGTSNINDKSHVWVLVHFKLLAGQWWPQDKPRVDANGNWEALVYFGGPQDIGFDFEIAVATFDEKAEKEILAYHEYGRKSGQWLPIEFPATTSNVDIVTVRKTSH